MALPLPRCPGGGTVPRSPPPRPPRGTGGDWAAAAGACSRNGHGWAGTPAPRLRARGQEQLVHGLSLTSPRVAAPACRCPPRHQAPRRLPAAETSQLITRVMPKPSLAPRAQRRRPGRAPPWLLCSSGKKILRRRLLSVPELVGLALAPAPAAPRTRSRAGRGRLFASSQLPWGTFATNVYWSFFIKVAKNLC